QRFSRQEQRITAISRRFIRAAARQGIRSDRAGSAKPLPGSYYRGCANKVWQEQNSTPSIEQSLGGSLASPRILHEARRNFACLRFESGRPGAESRLHTT